MRCCQYLYCHAQHLCDNNNTHIGFKALNFFDIPCYLAIPENPSFQTWGTSPLHKSFHYQRSWKAQTWTEHVDDLKWIKMSFFNYMCDCCMFKIFYYYMCDCCMFKFFYFSDEINSNLIRLIRRKIWYKLYWKSW